jgi:hypothetical protein
MQADLHYFGLVTRLEQYKIDAILPERGLLFVAGKMLMKRGIK